jgi:hypothetical protein
MCIHSNCIAKTTYKNGLKVFKTTFANGQVWVINSHCLYNWLQLFQDRIQHSKGSGVNDLNFTGNALPDVGHVSLGPQTRFLSAVQAPPDSVNCVKA